MRYPYKVTIHYSYFVTFVTSDQGTGIVPSANMALLIFCTTVTGIMTFLGLSVCRRSEYLLPAKNAISSATLTWSHILAVLTGPIESIQLIAVVLFFFWGATVEKGASDLQVGRIVLRK